MAAVMYLLLIWGYLTLNNPQWFAVFAALVMSITLLHWASEARQETVRDLLAELDEIRMDSAQEPCSQVVDCEPSVSASMSKLDSLKTELNQQYAQFGRDQSLTNSRGLGLWNRYRQRRGPGQ